MSQGESDKTAGPSKPPKGVPWGWIIGGLLVVTVTAGIFLQGSPETVQYYMTVGEYLDRRENYEDKRVKVAGKVQDGSLEKLGSNHYEFTVKDGEDLIRVRYLGYAPDTFKEGSEVVVGGLSRNSGDFEADYLMAKCASKYEEGDLPPLEKMKQKYSSNL